MNLNELLQSGFIFSEIGEDEVWVGWGNPIQSDGLGCTFEVPVIFASDFLLEDKLPYFTFPHVVKLSKSDLILTLKRFLQGSSMQVLLNWQGPSQEKFLDVFFEIKKLFLAGTLQKVVPVFFQEAAVQLSQYDKALFLLNLLENTRELPVSLYGIWDPIEGILGATPELLFSGKTGRKWQTFALAGTALKNHSGEFIPGSLLKSVKDQREHKVVIDGIKKDLAGWGEVYVGNTEEVELSTLVHLRTSILLEANSKIEFSKMVRLLHPTPALGAYPKEKGLQWLQSQGLRKPGEKLGAPFGWLHPDGSSSCVVSIRNLQWNFSHVRIGAGCGIVDTSLPDQEWLEILGKMKAVQKSFGLNYGV